ncbi:E3 SUMO-protein ligase ZBED1-like [Diretmus argenteus]
MSAELSDSILKMIIKDMRPIAIVEGQGFREMIKAFQPGYTLPSRHCITNLMEKKYEATLEKVKAELKKVKSKITLTTDAWTSIATEAYLGVTCHFINQDWELTSYSLTTMPLEERHTAENIAAWLVVNHALKKDPQINKALGAARSLVEHFRRSELASSKLKVKQKQMGTDKGARGDEKPHKLIQDVAVRWNSSYYMVQRLVEQRWPVTAAISDPEITPRGKHYLDLKSDQWALLEDLEQVLKPFEKATVFLSGQSYVTISALPPVIIKGLQRSTQKTTYESAPVNSFQRAAAQEIASRWEGETTFIEGGRNVSLIAAVLDPRFRKLKFLSSADVLKVQVKLQSLAVQAKRNEMEQLQQESVELLEQDDSDSEQPVPKRRREMSVLDALLGSSFDSEGQSNEEDNDPEDDSEMVKSEVLMYCAEQCIASDKSPLQWWKDNATRFPTLAILARSYLAVSATSTPSERLFSAAGNIVSKKRASLTAEHVDMLTFLHYNA